MKKLITMLLAMGLLALLSLGTVAYADEGGGNGDNGKEDDKYVVLCQEKDDEFKLIKVKKDDLEQYLEDDAFFPKGQVFKAEDEDKVIVKFVCDFKDNGNNGDNFEHVKVLLCQEKDDEFKLIKVKKDDLEQYLEDDAFFPKSEVFEAEDEGKVAVKFWCDNNGNDKDDKKVIYLFQADKDDNGDNNGKDKKNDAAIGIRRVL